MRGKTTKGKQKIDIKKVEKKKDRMITFSKRKKGIYKKLSELSTHCGADVGFLIYSDSGRPYTFGSPEFDDVVQRFRHGNHHLGINGEGNSLLSIIVDAHKKVKMDEICTNLNSLMEKTDGEEEKLKKAGIAYAPPFLVKRDDLLNIDSKDDEEEKQLLRMREVFYEEMCQVAVARSRGRCDALESSSFPPENLTRVNNNHHG